MEDNCGVLKNPEGNGIHCERCGKPVIFSKVVYVFNGKKMCTRCYVFESDALRFKYERHNTEIKG